MTHQATPMLTVYASFSSDSRIVTQLPSGTMLDVIDDQDEWSFIRARLGLRTYDGWVQTAYITPVENIPSFPPFHYTL